MLGGQSLLRNGLADPASETGGDDERPALIAASSEKDEVLQAAKGGKSMDNLTVVILYFGWDRCLIATAAAGDHVAAEVVVGAGVASPLARAALPAAAGETLKEELAASSGR